MKLNSREGGDLGGLFSRSRSRELGMKCPHLGVTPQIHCILLSPCRDSGRKFIHKNNVKILICKGASSCYSLASCPLNLLLVSAVGLLESQGP